MIKIASLSIAAALLACGLSAAPAHAANRTFVSGTGTDSGACTRAAPCKTFAFAAAQTAAGGEIDVVDTGDYGAVTITNSVSIVSDGAGVAGIQASSGNAITINAGAGDSVHMRGLTIAGLGSGANGIQFNTGGNLAIENCAVRNFALFGIFISPSTSSSFSVSNTIASNNGSTGILVQPTGTAVVKGVLGKVTTNNNRFGIIVDGSGTPGAVKVTIVDSEASNNSSHGVRAVSSETEVALRNVVATYNAIGLEAENNAFVDVGHSLFTGNFTGVLTSGGGKIFSYRDNEISLNNVDNDLALRTGLLH